MSRLLLVLAVVLAVALAASAGPEPSFAEVGAQVEVDSTMYALSEESMDAAELAESIAQESEEIAAMIGDQETSAEPLSLIEELASVEEASAKGIKKTAKKIGRKIAKGAKKLGRGIKKIFGGNKKKKAAKAAKKADKKMKKAAKNSQLAAALKSLAADLEKGGEKLRQDLLKAPNQVLAMARRLGLSVHQVRTALKHPHRAAKKAKKLNKKAKKQLKKANKQLAKKFQPKKQGILIKKTDITKKLKKVVEQEPESAAIAKAKNNWAWEDAVFSRLDTYAPPDPNQIKDRIDKFEKEADEQCNKAGTTCVQSHIDHPLNPKTCVKAKKACYHAKVALKVITKASVQCVETTKICGRMDWKGKGDCLVEKAKCKRLMMAVDHQYKKTQHAAKVVRDMQFNDGEANESRDVVVKKGEAVKAAQDDHDGKQEAAAKCKKVIDEWKTCQVNMDKSAECKKAKKAMEKCEDDDVVPNFDKAKDILKAAKKALEKAVQEKNAAEKEALQGF